MDIKIRVVKNEKQIMQKAKEIIWSKKLSLTSVISQLFKKITVDPDRVIKFLYTDM